MPAVIDLGSTANGIVLTDMANDPFIQCYPPKALQLEHHPR